MKMSRLSRRTVIGLFAGSGALMVSGAAVADAPDVKDKMIEGSVVYLERMMLPQGARVGVQLVDVSRADAPAIVLGATEIDGASASPIRFSLRYDPALIETGHRYALQARISLGDQLLFINDTHHAFDPGQESAEILVRRVASQAEDVGLPLFGSWLAEDIRGGGVIDRAQTTLEVAADGAVSGSGGCNRYAGKATVDGQKLIFSPLASTRRACVEALMNQEQKFHDALGDVVSFRIDQSERKLYLLDAGGETLVRFSSLQ